MEYSNIGIILIIITVDLVRVKGILEAKDLTFLILSQANKFNSQYAKHLELSICNQALAINQHCPPIYLSHQKFPHVGDWTILPILPKLSEAVQNSSWILIIEERTIIRLTALLETLEKYDSSKNMWLGYSLIDETPTIIHHFLEKKFSYPHLGAGIAISNSLLQNVSKMYSTSRKPADFSIDKSFELALFIWNDGNGPELTNDNSFCSINNNETCACFPEPFKPCSTHIETSAIYFAVKTCEKFHNNRIPVLLNTWAKYAENIYFFSDVQDDSIPTISLGISNTESGHCEKTLMILRYLYRKIEDDDHVQWVVLADDDTILSVMRLLELLSCYDSEDDVSLGERYGYDLHNPSGFNYITGGGSMVFSRVLLKKLVDFCKCPTISSPDDMIIGHCLAALGVQVTHSHLFHQARPMDYSVDFLKSDKHISFHKHWMVDPKQVYDVWFAEEDLKIASDFRIKYEL